MLFHVQRQQPSSVEMWKRILLLFAFDVRILYWNDISINVRDGTFSVYVWSKNGNSSAGYGFPSWLLAYGIHNTNRCHYLNTINSSFIVKENRIYVKFTWCARSSPIPHTPSINFITEWIRLKPLNFETNKTRRAKTKNCNKFVTRFSIFGWIMEAKRRTKKRIYLSQVEWINNCFITQ